MRSKIDNLYYYLIPILVIGVGAGVLPFIAILAILFLRLCTSDKHTAGFFLILFGGQLAACIRFEIPSLPIYGVMLFYFGFWLMRDMWPKVMEQKASIVGLLAVLFYFFLAYIFSPNVGEHVASEKIWGILQNGILMFYAYSVFIRSEKMDVSCLTQLLFLVAIVFMVHDMQMLGIRPNNIFDYEWLRMASDRIGGLDPDDPLNTKVISYHVIGMSALYGIACYLSQLNFEKNKMIVYALCALQLALLSGARQAILGFFIVAVLRLAVFNRELLYARNISKALRFAILGLVGTYIALIIIQSLGVSYLTETLQEGDDARDMLRITAWNLFYQYPIFGTGIGGFQHYTYMKYPHNFFAELFCECGIVGALFITIMVYKHFKKQNIKLTYLTNKNCFLFLVVSALAIRSMVSNDLSASIELISAVFACTNFKTNESVVWQSTIS